MKHSERLFRIALLLVFSRGIFGVYADDPVESTSKPEAFPVAQIILMQGAGGAPEFERDFSEASDKWLNLAKSASLRLIHIGSTGDSKETDLQQVRLAIEKIDADSPAALWLVMIGHGTFADGVAKFNLRGPDLSDKQLAKWLARFSRPVVVVNGSSASGPFINRLSGPNRVIVTATNSGNEDNYARFSQYFAEAISDSKSDLDHDKEVSVREAFLYASRALDQFYKAQNRIRTEHALLDDNGDGKGSSPALVSGEKKLASSKSASIDGAAAARISLNPTGGGLTLTAEQIEKRNRLERELDALKAQRENMDEEQFYAAVRPILIEIAKIHSKEPVAPPDPSGTTP